MIGNVIIRRCRHTSNRDASSKPPLMALPNIRPIQWSKHTLPDMLWLCSTLTGADELARLHLCSRVLDVLDAVVGPLLADVSERVRPVFDGRLASFEQVPDNVRGTILAELQARDLYQFAVPEGFFHALGMYPTAPGRWLLRRWLDRGLRVDWEAARGFLGPVIATASSGRDPVPTKPKFVVIARFFKAGKILIHKDANFPLDLLQRYPHLLNEGERKRAEAHIRAMFLAVAVSQTQQDGESLSTAEQWARTFWRSNWRLYPCVTGDALQGKSRNDSSTLEVRDAFSASARDLHRAFLQTARKSDPDLFEPDRYEVLTGITLRVVRLAVAAAITPILWSGEHGFQFLRSMVESQIVLRGSSSGTTRLCLRGSRTTGEDGSNSSSCTSRSTSHPSTTH